MDSSNISIAIGYHNRLSQLSFTLKRLQSFSFKGEIVIADDFSSPNHSAEQTCVNFPDLDIKVVYPEKKTMNPANAYNTAFRHCTKDIVFIQNAECAWVHNLAEYALENLRQGDYLVFSCKALSEAETASLSDSNIESVEGFMWYQHSESLTNNRCLHFCTALWRKDLNTYLGGGFDTRFYDGHSFDDDEFVHRVKYHLNVITIDTHSVVHQYHAPVQNLNEVDVQAAYERNRKLCSHTFAFYGTSDYKGILPIAQKE
jgi:glycosyltransferase involved in cell wall biosynthesis